MLDQRHPEPRVKVVGDSAVHGAYGRLPATRPVDGRGVPPGGHGPPAPESIGPDPDTIRRVRPVVEALLAYFHPEVRGFERLPRRGPMLLVGNHSGGTYMPDYWALWSQWSRRRGPEDPLYSLGFDMLFSAPGVGALLRRLGTVPASQANAARLLEEGRSVLVYPGGDEDVYRPWTDRHRIDLRGRTGFVRLALRARVPVIPVVSHGSHNAIVVVSRGSALARRLGLRRLRVNVLPLVLGAPWGLAPAPVPTWPLPSKVRVQMCEPLDWSRFGPEAAGDPDVVRACYDEIEVRMQSTLDELVAESPHPVLERLRESGLRVPVPSGLRL